MGADMLIAICRAPHSVKDKRLTGSNEILQEIKRRVDKIVPDDDNLERWADPDSFDDWDWDNYHDSDDDDERRDEQVAAYHYRLHMAARALLAHSREVTTIEIDRKYYLASGGMSWGDPPTDAYDSIALVDEAGIFDDPFPVVLTAPDVVG